MNALQVRFGPVLRRAILYNPAYLISAALTAAGARLLLVNASDPAGDVRIILLTLAALQIYEWAVAAILIALHRANRSPEDKPSLLLVAAAFWTGPIAATIEMIALRPDLGTYLAAGACVIALGEMRLCSRVLGLRLTGAAQAVCAACVMLLAAAAPLLKTPESDSGANELYLYATWWVFAAVVLGCTAAVRSRRKRSVISNDSIFSSCARQEFAFIAITIAATATHLYGMNYGFYCHAAAFYAAPVVAALSVVGFEILSIPWRHQKWALAIPFILPVVAMLLALQPFDPWFPVERLPAWARDPLPSIAAIAAIAWWFGYARHRRVVLLHAGNAALAIAALQLTRGKATGIPQLDSATLLFGLYVAVGYFAVTAWLCRSRVSALAALCIHLAATIMLVRGKTPADTLIVSLVAGWSALAGIHLAARRPRLWLRLAPIAFLALIPWTLDSAPLLRSYIAMHSIIFIAILFALGHVWRWTRYRSVAILLSAGQGVALIGYRALQSAHPAAVTLVIAGFALLAGGALISWHKAGLLRQVGVGDLNAVLDQAERNVSRVSRP